jgi:hypothetical protein
MTPSRLIEIIVATNYDPRRYSGRRMNGKECIGVTVKDGAMGWLASAIEECDDTTEAAWLIGRVNIDDMGRGEILYWPQMVWPQENEAAT